MYSAPSLTSSEDPVLGTLLREYRVGWRLYIMVLFVVIFFAAASVFGYLSNSDDLGTILFAGFLLYVALGATLYYLLKRRYRVELYSNGVRLLRGKAFWQLPWVEIESVSYTSWSHEMHGVSGPTYSSITVEGRDGLRISMDNHLEGFKELSEVVNKETFPRIWSRSLKIYSSGGILVFGRFRLSKDKLEYQKRSVALSNITKFAIDSGRVLIRVRGKLLEWAVEPVRKIPNVLVFLKFMNDKLGTDSQLSPESG